MPLPQQILKRLPAENQFDLGPMARGARAQSLDQLYSNGFHGCFVDSEDTDQVFRDAARYLEDEATAESLAGEFMGDEPELPPYGGREGCHVYTQLAFDAHRRDGQIMTELVFNIVQMYGNCVDASGVYADDYVMGVQVELGSHFNVSYAMKHLASFYHYGNRGYCSDGWYPAARGNEALKNGWCPAKNHSGIADLSSENEQERLTGRSWCRRGVPNELEEYCRQNYGWKQGGIKAFKHNGDQQMLKDLFRRGGCFNHGSNRTGAGRPKSLKRIGGHAQTGLGGDWSDECLEWFDREHGIKFTKDDFPCPQGQQWGMWGGQTPTKYWPKHLWGNDVPVGFWLISSRQLASSLFSGSAYLPGFSQGDKGERPVPNPNPVEKLEGLLYVEVVNGRGVIRGAVQDEDGNKHIATPVGDDRFALIARPVI